MKKLQYNGSSKIILRLCEAVNSLIDGGGGGGGSVVTYTQVLQSGTKTGEISINGTSTNMYAPIPPTKLSDLSNDTGFVTNTVNNLVNYYKKSETYTQAEVDALISAIVTLNILVVQTLPTQDISTTTIYLVPKATAGTQDVYDEYIYVNNAWEHVGSTEIDLSNYYTKTEVDALIPDVNDILLRVYPVGSIYLSVDAANPGTKFGGTWVAWGSGKVPVGVDTSDTDFNTVEKTGGTKSVTLTAAQSGVPAHSHGLNSHTHSIPALSGTASGGGHTHSYESYNRVGNNGVTTGDSNWWNLYGNNTRTTASGGGTHSHTVTTNASTTGQASGSTANNTAANASQAHTNLQPYITCYMWKRTA